MAPEPFRSAFSEALPSTLPPSLLLPPPQFKRTHWREHYAPSCPLEGRGGFDPPRPRRAFKDSGGGGEGFCPPKTPARSERRGGCHVSQTRGEPRKTRGNHLFKDSHRKGGVIFLKTHKRGSVPQTSSDPADLPTLKTKDAITMKHVCTIAAKPCRCVCLCVCISMRVQGKGGKGARGEAGGVWEGEGARGGGRRAATGRIQCASSQQARWQILLSIYLLPRLLAHQRERRTQAQAGTSILTRTRKGKRMCVCGRGRERAPGVPEQNEYQRSD